MRMPAVYLPHGGGPWPFIRVPLGTDTEQAALRAYLASLPALLPQVRSLLVISAHWEEKVPTVQTAAAPKLMFDYYGFPPEAYQITWPAPGNPALADRVLTLLGEAELPSATNGVRGYDHGTFVPLKVAWPAADVPTVQLSLVKTLDPALHLRIGRALAPLRDEGVLIVGSGMSYHNIDGFGVNTGRVASVAFDRWMRRTVALPQAKRDAALTQWSSAPSARDAHPREDHLLPLMVVAGAAGSDLGQVPFSGSLLGVRVSAAHFG